MATPSPGSGEALARIFDFVAGANRLAISSPTLAELLGLSEEECHAALEEMAAGGLLRRETGESGDDLYCKG